MNHTCRFAAVGFLFSAAAALSVGCAAGAPPEEAEATGETEQEIYGGSATHARPWMVALRANGVGGGVKGQFCGGTAVSSRWVVTAGHCVDDVFVGQGGTLPLSAARICAGKQKLSDCSDASDARLVRILKHPLYLGIDGNDIALVQVDRDLPGKLPYATADGQEPAPGKDATLIGWGWSARTITKTNVLQTATVQVVGEDACADKWGVFLFGERKLCTTANPDGFCLGDSGGPVIGNGRLVGVVSYVSFSDGRCDGKRPNVSTRVAPYAPWIKACVADPTSIACRVGG